MSNEFFLSEMRNMIPEEYDRFMAGRDELFYRGLRINTLKTDFSEINGELSLGSATPFDENSYYIDNEDRPGRHPWHLGGLFYLQEPSAAMAVNALNVRENDRVLDLCAAPGGKSTQILSALKGTGLLWSNEINGNRAITLLSNIERWGTDNYIITSLPPQKLCPQLQGYFNRVLVDAPCSGSGMFRKYPETVDDYTEASVEACSRRQLLILNEAYQTLKTGGIMVYSTCTFTVRENEHVIAQFIKQHPDMMVEDTGLTCGRPGIAYDDVDWQKMRRCFPMDGGEGHFVCRMVKTGSQPETSLKTLPFSRNKTVDDFLAENCLNGLSYTIINDGVHASSQPLLDFRGGVIRQGILLGTLVKGRLEPHHHGAVAIGSQYRQTVALDEKETEDYLKGLSITRSGIRGYAAVTYKNHPLGLVKGDGRQLKNRLPKGLRRA